MTISKHDDREWMIANIIKPITDNSSLMRKLKDAADMPNSRSRWERYKEVINGWIYYHPSASVKEWRTGFGAASIEKYECYVFIHMSIWRALGFNPTDVSKVFCDGLPKNTYSKVISDYVNGQSPYSDYNNCNEPKQFNQEYQAVFSNQEKTTMIAAKTEVAVPFETRSFIFGRDANTMSEDDLIDAIKRIEAVLVCMCEIKTESKKIAEKKKALVDAKAKIVAILDAR